MEQREFLKNLNALLAKVGLTLRAENTLSARGVLLVATAHVSSCVTLSDAEMTADQVKKTAEELVVLMQEELQAQREKL